MPALPIEKGARVRVYPVGARNDAAIGVVMLISGNQRSIAVAFEHFPPFAFREIPFAVADCGPILLALRDDRGIWVDLAGNVYYEIEAA